MTGVALSADVHVPAYKCQLQPASDKHAISAYLNTFPIVLLTVLPLQNMHPLMDIVHPYSAGRVKVIVISTMAITGFYYWFVSLCAWLVFGPSIEDDILTNLSVVVMQPLIGAWPAAMVGGCFMYCI